MKMFRTAAILAALLLAGPALAQQTAIHSVPIGKGAGNTGFNAAAPGTAGQPLVSQGASADPAFGTIANSGFTPGAANTAKGSLNGTTTVDIPLPSCTAVNSAWRYVNGTGINCGQISVTTGYDMPINLGLSVPAPSGNALVINLTQANGTAPTSTNPVLVPFRSTALATGMVTWSTITATQSITIVNGASLGTLNGVPFRIWIFEEYNGGTPELAVATCSNQTTIFPCASWESTLPTSTTISASSGTGGTLYSTTGVTADAVRIIGYCDFANGLTTAGAWSSACTTLQVFGPGVSKPGSIVQTIYGSTTTPTTVSSATKAATNLNATIAMTSTVNLVRVQTYGGMYNTGGTGGNAGFTQLYRGTGTTAVGNVSPGTPQAAAVYVPATNYALDAPGVAGSVQYGLYITGASNSTWVFLSTSANVGTATGDMELDEIMG